MIRDILVQCRFLLTLPITIQFDIWAVLLHYYLPTVSLKTECNTLAKLSVRYTKENLACCAIGRPLFGVVPLLVLSLRIKFTP